MMARLDAPRSNPFATAKAAADAAYDADASQGSELIRAVHEEWLTAGASGSPAHQQQPQQHRQKAKRSSSFADRLLTCLCVRPEVLMSDDDDASSHHRQARPGADTSSSSGSSNSSSRRDAPRKKAVQWSRDVVSPRHLQRLPSALIKQSSAGFDADWFDARSEFSSALSSAASDQGAKLEELSAMLRDMHHAASSGTAANPATAAGIATAQPEAAASGPHIPNPPLAFAGPELQFVPVPAVTGFAAYWERDAARSTPYPTPIDTMIKASALAHKSHESIPGIWLQEGPGQFSVTVKPRFLPAGLPRYTETYDKSMATEPTWPMRRDLRLGSTAGQIYATACGMLILRARSKPLFGGPDMVMEEYMRLEEGGAVIVDRQCCLDLRTGKRCTQYLVGRRHEVPPKGHV